MTSLVFQIVILFVKILAELLLIILVQIFQSLGTHLATKSDKRLKK